MGRGRLIAGVAFALALASVTAIAGGKSNDYGKLTCGEFLASGTKNMAVIIWWLRGYHAGKSGNATFDSSDTYAARLGFFCGSNRPANLIETSERILSELERGI